MKKRPNKEIWDYSLPIDESEEWSKYWISFCPKEGFTEYLCSADKNIYLTEEYLFQNVLDNLQNRFSEKIAKIGDRFNKRRIYITIAEFELGKQTVFIEPYFLKISGELGFLIDFHFLSNDKGSLTKEGQKLALSLNTYYRSNTNYHIDKFKFVQDLITSITDNIDIKAKEINVHISDKLRSLNANFLKTKTYRFFNEKTNNSQFQGLKNNSPYQKISGNVHFYFIFKEIHIDLGRELIKALNGETFKYTFPGMEKMFELKLNKENVSKIIIEDFNQNEIKKSISTIKNANNKQAVAILLFPEKESDFYYQFKNNFLKNGILTQGVHIKTMRNTSGLKWSISSIGLQIFSKAGGIPWRVTPSNENCLIIGIGKAHRITIREDGHRQVEKFYAYSVLTDSSGEYISMNVLSNESNEDNYLDSLMINLKKTIEKYNKEYSKITLHIPFKVKQNELKKITEVIKSIDNRKDFAVLKINDNSKFFGYNTLANSLVPYESSMLKISDWEYLIWTEGMNYHNNKANKKFSNPLHVEFYYPKIKEIDDKTIKLHLQDIMNLSGASWRGFNAKSVPISMFYPKIISGFIKEFNSRNLSEINFENLPPWFL